RQRTPLDQRQLPHRPQGDRPPHPPRRGLRQGRPGLQGPPGEDRAAAQGRVNSRNRMNTVIEVRGLVKEYGDFTAVAGIDFDVYQGEIFGFLGPNGAGKPTTINILATLLRPTRGTAVLAGHDIVAEPTGVRQSIGIVFQDPSLDERLTAEENLWFHAMLYNVP